MSGLRYLEVQPSRPVPAGAPIFASDTKTEPLRVTVTVDDRHDLAHDKIELWSADGPGHPGARRLSSVPAEIAGRKAVFTLPLGVAVPPARLTAVVPRGVLATSFPVLSSAQFRAHLAARLVTSHSRFAVDETVPGRLEDLGGRVVHLDIETHSSLVNDVVRFPVNVVHLPTPLTSTHNLIRAIALSGQGKRPCADGTPVHVWETRVVGQETLTIPQLNARFQETLPSSANQMIRISRNPTPGHPAPGTLPVDPAFRLAVAAKDPGQASRMLTHELLAALDELLALLGTQRVILDRNGFRTTLSTGVFTDRTLSDWLDRVLAVSRAYHRARAR